MEEDGGVISALRLRSEVTRMEVVARAVDLAKVPPELTNTLVPGQVFITAGKRYEVFALAVFSGRVMLQVLDDLRYPAWFPVWLFDVTEQTMPSDWMNS